MSFIMLYYSPLKKMGTDVFVFPRNVPCFCSANANSGGVVGDGKKETFYSTWALALSMEQVQN